MNITHFKIQEYAVEWECTEKKENSKIMCPFSQSIHNP